MIMKKVLFVLFVSLIGFGAKTYSQTTVSLDSIEEKLAFIKCPLSQILDIFAIDFKQHKHPNQSSKVNQKLNYYSLD